MNPTIKRIDRAFLDRGFANSKCVKSLNKNRIKFVMPVPRNNRIKQWMDKSEECKARLIENYESKTIRFI